MSKLKQIIAAKVSEVEKGKKNTKISDFEATSYFSRIGKSLSKSLVEKPGIITGFKRSNLAEGAINDDALIQSVVRGYSKAGATAVSVVTDAQFYGGSLVDLKRARQITDLPILRKDFIIDEFQVYESKAYGADVISLVAEALEAEEIEHLAQIAKKINLEVVLEIHSENHLAKLNEFIDIVAVNNRDFVTLNTDFSVSKNLATKIPTELVKISESGYTQPEQVYDINKNYGYQGFIIGSYFMKQESPVEAATEFIAQLS